MTKGTLLKRSFCCVFLEANMKKSFVVFLSVFLSFLCLGCPNVDCEVVGYGEVYLKVLDENGKPFSDSEAKRFKVQHNNLDLEKQHTIINEKDELIFSLGTIKLEYNSCKRIKKKEGFTDSEIRNALDDAFCFSIKDIKVPQEYKTIVNKSCNSCFVSFVRTNVHPASYVPNNKPTHIYYCEVRLTKKE